MINLLAAALESTATGVIVGGGACSIGAWIIKRQLKRVADHVDDDTKHVSSHNGYVSKSLCKERSGNIEARLENVHTDIREILNRLPPK